MLVRVSQRERERERERERKRENMSDIRVLFFFSTNSEYTSC